MTDPADEPPLRVVPRLDYRVPEPPPPLNGAIAFLGFVLAVLFWGSVGFFNLDKLRTPIGSGGAMRPPNIPVVASFFLLAAATFGTFIALRKDRRYLLLGLLLGTAVMGLVEGICFMTN
jgi:hypothetical protein